MANWTVRDEFAAAALLGFVMRFGKIETDSIPHDSYKMADAMLAERERGK